jgi:hypothetical protein
MRVLLVSFILISFFACNNSEDEDNKPNLSNDSVRIDSLSMGADYANDIFYNLKTCEATSVPRNNWDIAFKTDTRSSTILINSTAGVNLWEYPVEDTSKWRTVDTTGMKNNWASLVNSDTTWSLGAFERNMKGHPDYGWSQYNSLSHDLIGNSIFIIQLQDGSFKKIMITKREATTNTYYFKYANLNGSASTEKNIKITDYTKKNFVYYSISAGKIVDREPESDKWDVVFTRYIALVSMGPGSPVPYPVVGFLQNEGVLAAKITGDTASNNYQNVPFKTSFETIGREWKKQVSQTSSDFIIVPDLYYFVKTKDKSTVKLLFRKYEGNPTNKVVFERKILK